MSEINQKINNCFDWQVTTCFYVALHLVNAHLSHSGLQYRKHTDVKDALNPFKSLSITKIDKDEYFAYNSLQSLSRRARYLVNEKDDNLDSDKAHYTYEKHLSKALRHLNTLIDYFSSKYGFTINPIQIKCQEIKSNELKYFQKI